MALDPAPFELVSCGQLIQPLPQVLILDRLLVGRAPPALLPVMHPLGDPAAHVLRVGVDAGLDWTLERLKRAYDSCQLHAVVSREALGATQFLLGLTHDQQRTPASGSGISAARTV